ncbi:hypothetical protein BX600DRAFT_547809 [Xylariales sp. PMI_506]|nr:hypothetical protein BX600DRAFT_547809 [Xylariales sp. PMI_506]
MTSPISNILISATTEATVLNNDGNCLEPGQVFKAWQETAPTANIDGPTGSLFPIALNIPKDATSTYSIPKLQVTGKCLYPKDYPRIATCNLVGTLKDGPKGMPSITSKTWNIALPTTNPPSDQLLELNAEEFTIPATITDKPCPVPFRVAGDFQWAVICTLPDAKPLSYDKDTRLELVWLGGPALSGPGKAVASIQRTAVDLCGSYPINLLRLYLPSPSDITQLLPESGQKLDFKDWWIQTSLKRIPAALFSYNTIDGKSGFGLGCCGGSLALQEFTSQALSTSNPRPALINSFDLAALSQLSYSLLVNKQGEEVQYSQWVCKTPFGPVKAGMPFGISDKTIPSIQWPKGINNPYFFGSPTQSAFEAEVGKRQICNAKAWVEPVLYQQNTNIVDASWAVPYGEGKAPETELRTRERKPFAEAHIDQLIDDATLHCYADNDVTPKAECFSNESFGKEPGDSKKINRIGIYNVKGILEPRHGGPTAEFVPVPPSLRKKIEALILSCKSSKEQRWMFNDSSLRTKNVKPILVDKTPLTVESPKEENQTNIKVVPGASCASWLLANMPVTDLDKNGRVAVNISVYDNFQDTYEAFVFELTKYECDISTVTEPLKEVGHFGLQTPHSVLFMRGNLFIDITIKSLYRPDDAARNTLKQMAARLDAYLARRVVSHNQIRRPHLSVASTSPDLANTIKEKTRLDVSIKNSATLAPVLSGQADRGALVVPLSMDYKTYTCKFWVAQKFIAHEAPTSLTISGAHFDTFHPGSCTLHVNVGDAK